MKLTSLFCSLVLLAVFGLAAPAQGLNPTTPADTSNQEPKDGSRFNTGSAQTANDARTKQAMANIEKAISVLIPGGIEEGTQRKKNFATVIGMFGRGDARDAMDALEKMASDDPQLPPAEIMLAGLTFAVGDSKSGTALLESAAIKYPEYPGVYLSFAQLALNTNRITDASLHADKTGVLLNSGNLSPEMKNHFLKQYYEIVTGVHLRRKQNQQANDALEKLQAVVPNLPFYFFNKAELAFRSGQNDVALQFLKQHAAAIKSKRLPELTLVDWLRSSGKNDAAEAFLLETRNKYPQDAQTQLMTAQMYLAKEEFPKALIAIRKFEEINGSETTVSLDMKGRIAFAGQSYELAAEHFLNLNKLAPNDLNSANIFALSLVQSDDPEKRKQAEQISKEVAGRMQNNPLALASLGYIYLKNGELEKSRQLMGRVATMRQATPEISFFLSSWLVENKQTDQAIAILKQIVDTKRLFLYRSSARKLLASIEKK